MSSTAVAVPSSESALLDRLDERTLEILEQRQGSGHIQRRGWLVRRALLVADVVGLFGAFVVVEYFFVHRQSGHVNELGEYLLFALSLPGWIVVAKLYGLYERDEERTDHTTVGDMTGVFHLLTVGVWILFGITTLTGLAKPEVPKLASFWLLGIALVAFARVAARGYCRQHIAYLQNTVIVGAGTVGQNIGRKLLRHPEYGINLVGFVDSNPKTRDDRLEHLAILGDIDDLPGLVELLDIERVIVAFSNDGAEEVLTLVRQLHDLGVQVDIVPRFFDLLSDTVDIHAVEGLPLIGLRPPRLSNSSAFIKRLVDVLGSAIGLVFLLPLFAAVALAIKLDSGGPVFFRQVRMGSRDQTFRIWKFRTMNADAEVQKADVAYLNKHAAKGAEARMFKIPDDPRITRVGRFLRRTSLDELPQLLNVLVGQMSLVGPRPLILDEHEHVEPWALKRVDLQPGMTGLWQVLGSSDIPFDEMITLDYRYVSTWSLATDLKLLIHTVPTVLRSRNS
jgi:exopolysaccharide biosynthesis polyprenyl glycosylphosphotransferase